MCSEASPSQPASSLPYVELLSAGGHLAIDRLTAGWRRLRPASLRRVYDLTAKTYVFTLQGSPSTACRVTAPANTRTSLNVHQQYLGIQLRIFSTREFSLETTVKDDNGNSRTLKFSTLFDDETPSAVDHLQARVSLQEVPRGEWINLILPLAALLHKYWPGSRFDCIASVTVCANCSFRYIFALKKLTITATKQRGGRDLTAAEPRFTVPRQLRMPAAVPERTWVLDAEHLLPHLDQSFEAFTAEITRSHYEPEDSDRIVNGSTTALQALRIRRQNNVSSAPPGQRLSTKTPNSKKRPTADSYTAGSVARMPTEDGCRSQRSSSLPKLPTRGSLVSRDGAAGATGCRNKHKHTPKQAWRGPSAHAVRRSTSHSRFIGEDAVLRRVLSERLEAVLSGPDEYIRRPSTASSSEETVPAYSTTTVIPFPSKSINHKRPSILSSTKESKVSSHSSGSSSVHHREALWPHPAKLQSGRDDNVTASILKKSKEKSMEEQPNPIWPVLGAGDMDEEERQMLASLRREANDGYEVEKSSHKHHNHHHHHHHGDRYRNKDHNPTMNDGRRSSLSRHEFDDSASSDDGADTLGPLMQTGQMRSSPAAEAGLFELESSLLTSQLSTHLSEFREQYKHGQNESSGAHSSNHKYNGHHQKKTTDDSGCGSDDGVAPVLDLIFDPDLNCYYNPTTRQYYRVTPAGTV